MERRMRRSRQALTPAQCDEVLRRGTSGVLALAGDDGFPYSVPLSYFWMDGKFYFHCAKAGYKLDCIRRSAKASFCVIDQDEVIPEEYTTYFRSVIATGMIRELTDPKEIHRAITALAARFRPGFEEAREKAVQAEWGALCLLELTPAAITGKEAIGLVRQREKGCGE